MKKTLLTMSIIAATALVGCDDDKKTKIITETETITEYVDKGLAEITDEQAGDNCEFGGKKVIKGIDADDSGFLEGAELDAITTIYVCSEYEITTEVVINTIDATQEQIDDAVENAVAPFLLLQTELETANADLTTAQATVTDLEAQLSLVEGSLEISTGEVASLTAELEEANQALSDATADVARLEDELDFAGEIIAELTSDLIISNTDLAFADANVVQLTTQLITANDTVFQLTTDIAAANASVSQLTSDLATANGDNAQLTADLNGYMNYVMQLVVDLAAANAALAQVETDLEIANLALAIADSNVTQLTADLATANASVSQLTADLINAENATVLCENELLMVKDVLDNALDDLVDSIDARAILFAEKIALENQLMDAITALEIQQKIQTDVMTQIIAQFVDSGIPLAQATSLANSIFVLTGDELSAFIVAAYLDRTKVIFVTSGSWTGNLGGLAGADAKCQAQSEGELSAVPVGTYKAWLSDSGNSAASRISNANNMFERPDGAIIAYSWADFTDGSLENPINVDENGYTVSGYVHTNTYANGSAVAGSNGSNFDNCTNFTYGEFFGDSKLGNIGSTSSSWSYEVISDSTMWCNELHHLYCIQQ